MRRAKSPAAAKTLAVVGWASRVKDPLWAIEVLARLRAVDPAWRMLFVGADFPTGQRALEEAYAESFRRRVLAPDVLDGVHFTGFSTDLPRVFEGVGYVVSSSRRESFGVALVEGMASGAVPVVRDWPIFAGVDAARRALSPRWVVTSPEEAAERILAIDAAGIESEAPHVREWVDRIADQSSVSAAYIHVLRSAHDEAARDSANR